MANNNQYQSEGLVPPSDGVQDPLPLVGQALFDAQGNAAPRRLPPQEPEGEPSPPSQVVEIESEISEELSADVLENDLLLPMILNYVIFPNGKVCPRNLKNVRLVRKKWLVTIAESMRKSTVPVFGLTVDNKNVKLLDQFVRDMSSTDRVTNLIPPLSLQLAPEFFRRENYKNLSDYLPFCGESLIYFHIDFPKQISMTLVFPSFRLSRLQHLTVNFAQFELNDPAAVNNSNALAIDFLQTILNGADDLKQLHIFFHGSEALIPFKLEYLTFPTSITSLQLDIPLKESVSQLILNNELPNLTILGFLAPDKPYSGETISQILEKFKATLTRLELNGPRDNYRYGHSPTKFLFPVMEKLKSITVANNFWGFKDYSESQLPKLHNLTLQNTNAGVAQKFVKVNR